MCPKRGTTLSELLVALTVTGLVALAVAGILQAASYGTSSKREVRRLVVRSEQLRNRIDDTVREARAVLAGGTDLNGNTYLVLWRGDTNNVSTNQDKVNLSELQMLEWSAAASTLSSYTPATTPNPDTAYEVTADFHAAAHALPATVWAGSVSGFSTTLNQAPPMTRLVTWSITAASDLVSERVSGSAALLQMDPPN